MKKYILLCCSFLGTLALWAQEGQSLQLNARQIESLFLQNNLELLAERMNIDLADAEIMQAKLWDNPTLTVDQVNLWSSNSQREGEKEVIPPVFGKFARNTQFSIELSQLIQTANKRNKLIGREKIGKQIIEKEFEELLRNLKIELRKAVSEVEYLQKYELVLSKQQISLSQLVESYRKQVAQGNIAKSELLRLQSSLLEINSEHYEAQVDLNENLSTLKILLAIPPSTHLQIVDMESDYKNPQDLIFQDMLILAEENRPDMQATKLQTEYSEKSLSYEKSLRVPDITLSANYDRRGGVWRDFIGVGVSIDIPFFNRNQGGIKAARITQQQSWYKMKQELNILEHEVSNALSQYMLAYQLYQKVNDDDLLTEMENMQTVYGKYLVAKNISMLEYIDFMDASKTSMQTVLTARKQLNIQFEELQYTIGTDIK